MNSLKFITNTVDGYNKENGFRWSSWYSVVAILEKFNFKTDYDGMTILREIINSNGVDGLDAMVAHSNSTIYKRVDNFKTITANMLTGKVDGYTPVVVYTNDTDTIGLYYWNDDQLESANYNADYGCYEI